MGAGRHGRAAEVRHPPAARVTDGRFAAVQFVPDHGLSLTVRGGSQGRGAGARTPNLAACPHRWRNQRNRRWRRPAAAEGAATAATGTRGASAETVRSF